MTASPVLVPHAGVDSNPRTTSGPADSSCIFAPQGHPIHPGIVSLPGSQSVLEPPVVVFSSDREPRRRALSPDGHGGTFHSLTSRNQLGGNSARHCAQGHPGLGSLHVLNMEQPNAELVASAYVNPRG